MGTPYPFYLFQSGQKVFLVFKEPFPGLDGIEDSKSIVKEKQKTLKT